MYSHGLEGVFVLSGWVEMEVPDRVALSVEQLFGIVCVLAAGIHYFCFVSKSKLGRSYLIPK